MEIAPIIVATLIPDWYIAKWSPSRFPFFLVTARKISDRRVKGRNSIKFNLFPKSVKST